MADPNQERLRGQRGELHGKQPGTSRRNRLGRFSMLKSRVLL
jgi:hypothetical protein